MLEAVVAVMCDQGAARERIVAAVGPAIAQESYEVGPELAADFLALDEKNASYFANSRRPGHKMFDLKGLVTARLADLGLAAVAVQPEDTYQDSARFFSYRRSCHLGEKDYGRGLSVIMLADDQD